VAETIRITDLAEPDLTDVQKGALAYGETVETDLSLAAVLAAARAQTGLDDFGARDFEERLALWLSEQDEDPERTALGRMNLFNDCVRYASNRLKIEKLLADHPEIHEQEITRPIIVLGLFDRQGGQAVHPFGKHLGESPWHVLHDHNARSTAREPFQHRPNRRQQFISIGIAPSVIQVEGVVEFRRVAALVMLKNGFELVEPLGQAGFRCFGCFVFIPKGKKLSLQLRRQG